MTSDPQSYAKILAELRGSDSDKVKGLQTFSEVLIFADREILDEIPLPEFIFSLLNLLHDDVSLPVLILTLQCINSMLPIHFAASILFLRLGLLQNLNTILETTDSPDAAVNSFRILSFFAQETPQLVSHAINTTCFAKFIPIFARVDQRECVSLLALMTPTPENNMAGLIPFLTDMIQNEDQVIRMKSLTIFSSIVINSSIDYLHGQIISEKTIQILCELLDANNINFETYSNLVRILKRISSNPDNCQYIYKYMPDLTNLLFSHDHEQSESYVLDIIKAVLPIPPLPKEICSRPNINSIFHKKQAAEEIVNTVLPVLVIYLSEKQSNVQSCLEALATCASLSPFSCDSNVLNILLRRSYNVKCAPYVLVIAANLISKADVVRCGLLKNLSSIKLPRNIRGWCSQYLSTLKEQCKPFSRSIPVSILRCKNIDEIIQYVEHENLFPFEFFDSKLMEKTIPLLKQNPRESSFLHEIGLRSLDFLPFPKTFVSSDTHTFSKQLIKFSITGPGGALSECQLPIHSDFMMIEGWYNLRYNTGCVERLQSSIADNPLLQMMTEIEEDLTRSHMRFALLCRAFQTDRYYRCSFKVGGIFFSAFDNLTFMLSKVCSKPANLTQSRFDIVIVHSEVKRSAFAVKDIRDNSLKTVIQYISLFKSNMINEKFAKYVFSKLDNPLMTLTLLSPSVQIMYHAPFLFTFEQRLFLFKTVGLDTVFGMKNIHDHFPRENDKKCKAKLSTVKCTITRDTTFEHGCFLLSRFGCGRLRLEFVFQNDVGFGGGPTQEFFAIMSREFCRRQTKMWRDDNLVESDVIVCPYGLFPSVNADNGLLEVLGILCSKAIITEKIIDIPFNPAFFVLILTGKVAIEKVDPTLANSLKYPEGLYDLSFIYPGSNIELKKGGKNISVNSTNVQEYIDLVKDFTCGSQMLKKIEHFTKTFESNIPIESLSIFKPEEIVRVICGEEARITKEDLLQNVKVEHGYNKNSREIRDLFEIIDEMTAEEQGLLCKFIFGCTRLPNGGLKGLKPPLTIAKRVAEQQGSGHTVHPDEWLPSVMTCFNYFKLPPYSTKDIMKVKVLQAISEGQDTFLLS